jgi:hypothetical protein
VLIGQNPDRHRAPYLRTGATGRPATKSRC